MISKTIQKALNDQINRELFSSYLYLAMSAHCAEKGYKGTAKWFRVQFQEELDHAMKFFDYVLSQGGAPDLGVVAKPETPQKTLLELFESTLAHEQSITKALNDLMNLAVSEKDFATQALLQWYITEQVEEEANDLDVVTMLKMAGNSSGTLLMIDKQLGKRGAAA
ncbi:MAG: ferritin [bacterium]